MGRTQRRETRTPLSQLLFSGTESDAPGVAVNIFQTAKRRRCVVGCLCSAVRRGSRRDACGTAGQRPALRRPQVCDIADSEVCATCSRGRAVRAPMRDYGKRGWTCSQMVSLTASALSEASIHLTRLGSAFAMALKPSSTFSKKALPAFSKRS